MAIAVTTGERLAALPDVPTMVESGLPKFQNASWFALYTRGGVSRPVLSKLEAEALRVINSPDVVARTHARRRRKTLPRNDRDP